MHSQKGFAAAAWIAIAAVVLLGGGAYVYMNPGVLGTSDAEEGSDMDADMSVNFEGSLTMEELLSRGQDVTCTFAFEGGDSRTTGTVFVAGGMLRGDYQTVASGKTVLSHTIVRDGSAHFWMDSSATGFKGSATGAVTTSGSAGTPDLNSKLDYTCVPWVKNDSTFTLPANVTFTSMGSIPMPS